MVSRTFQLNYIDDVMHKVVALVNASTSCKCQVFVSTAVRQIKGDSMLGLIMLFGDTKEQTITISTDGADEQETMEKIESIFDCA